jgi:hypothetical protein
MQQYQLNCYAHQLSNKFNQRSIIQNDIESWDKLCNVYLFIFIYLFIYLFIQ